MSALDRVKAHVEAEAPIALAHVRDYFRTSKKGKRFSVREHEDARSSGVGKDVFKDLNRKGIAPSGRGTANYEVKDIPGKPMIPSMADYVSAVGSHGHGTAFETEIHDHLGAKLGRIPTFDESSAAIDDVKRAGVPVENDLQQQSTRREVMEAAGTPKMDRESRDAAERAAQAAAKAKTPEAWLNAYNEAIRAAGAAKLPNEQAKWMKRASEFQMNEMRERDRRSRGDQ